jgi:PAS domain S-box-containing protein
VAILDAHFRLQAMNKALEAMTGLTRDEALGVPCQYIIRNNLCLKMCPAKQAIETEQTVRIEGNIVNTARQKIPVMIHASPMKNNRGQHIGVIETVEDLSLVQGLDKRIHTGRETDGLIGHSPNMQKLLEVLPVISQTDSSVLIIGETGTGKDLIAIEIHRLSQRSQGPFIKVNCGALPETLLESELFGHMRGAFTGAIKDKPGRFQLAHNGTIYFTEIGDLPLPLQVKLLTVLDDKEFYPLGGTKSIKADVRVIAATHRDLRAMIRQGSFREDLLYRLNIVRIDVVPLRDRGDDIRLLMEHFLNLFKKKFHKNIQGFSSKVLEILKQYPYPGNVREVKNIVEYAANICPEGIIQLEQLPDYLQKPWGEILHPDPGEKIEEGTKAFPLQGESLLKRPTDHLPDWMEMERRMISEALLQSRGNRTKAADLLGWGRSTLWRKIKKHKLA